MPGPLPPASGYTYAVEMSVDEAVDAGADRVNFDKPVAFYVENFLGFPTGGDVPTGYYDRELGAWVPSDDGRIIEVLSTTSAGLARVDSDGDGQADTGADLAELGIDDDERASLANLYESGTSVWRVPMTHFTPWDHNWPYGPPEDALPPGEEPPGGDSDDQCQRGGSIIDCESQVLGEAIPITGTDISLRYSSQRVEGRVPQLRVPVAPSGDAALPASVQAIEITVSALGQQSVTRRSPTDQSPVDVQLPTTDVFGRQVQGDIGYEITVSYVYPIVYTGVGNFRRAFGRLGTSQISGVQRQSTVLRSSRTWSGSAYHWDGMATGIGGWTLDAVHHLAPSSQRVLYGDGSSRTQGDTLFEQSRALGGTGERGFSGDGGSALGAQFDGPAGIAVDEDGASYVADQFNNRIRRIDASGQIVTVAGTGVPGHGGDGGNAVDAQLYAPSDVEVGPDGSLYVATGTTVRRVNPEGVISTVLGREESACFSDSPIGEGDFATGADDDVAIGARRSGSASWRWVATEHSTSPTTFVTVCVPSCRMAF